jgi:hypothetical protein
MSEFSDFTKLVLDRMETNPDEFEAGNRWDTLVRALEARAIGDFENRYAKTLWPLEPLELEALMAKYRKLYLARIHKDMLRNIVSGADKERAGYQYDSGNDINPLKGHVLRGNGGISAQTLVGNLQPALNQAFDDAYAATPKMEGAQVPMSNTAGPKVSKFVLNRTQVEIAQRLGLTPWEYAKRYSDADDAAKAAVSMRINGGTV